MRHLSASWPAKRRCRAAAARSALVGAVGTALGNMVGSLTAGKKKYADVEADIEELMERAAALQKRLLALAEKDAEVFEPLSKAYGMPKDTAEEKAEKERVMALVLKDAAQVPLEIMEACCQSIDLLAEFAAKGKPAGRQRRRRWGDLLQGRPAGRQPQRVHQYQVHGGPAAGPELR